MWFCNIVLSMFGLNVINSCESIAFMFWRKASTCDKASPTLTQVHLAEIRFHCFISGRTSVHQFKEFVENLA